MKWERMKAIIRARGEHMKSQFRARLEMIEEKQSACVTKLNALAGVFPLTEETMPVKVQPKGHDAGSLLKFPVTKPASKQRQGLFSTLQSRK
jgi:hypothetical protein